MHLRMSAPNGARVSTHSKAAMNLVTLLVEFTSANTMCMPIPVHCAQEHLFLVCELLRANLYEFQKYNRESGEAPYFTNARIQRIARQVGQLFGHVYITSAEWLCVSADCGPSN